MVRADKSFQTTYTTPPAAHSAFGNRFPRLADAPATHGFYPPVIDRPEPKLPTAHHRQYIPAPLSRRGNHLLPGPQLPAIGWIGGDARSNQIVEQLRDRGHRVHTIEFATPFSALRELLHNPAHSFATAFSGLIDSLLHRQIQPLVTSIKALALAHHLRTLRVGRLHAPDSSVSATLAMYAAKQLRIPFSFSGVAAGEDPKDLPLKLRRAASVACVSYEQREKFLNIYPAADRYHVASNLLRLEICLASPSF